MDSSANFDPYWLDGTTPLNDPVRFPPGKHPYYIVTPRYVRTSAGVRALHLLCHCLNRAGQEAYVLIYPEWPNPVQTNPDLLTPMVTPEILAVHRGQRRAPVLIYPETVRGNPIAGRTIVRYVLNFPGHIAGDTSYAPNEIIFGYSATLAQAGGAPGQILFIPASDTTIFKPGAPRLRQGSCFWAMKYRLVHGAKPLPITDASIEITREREDSQTPEQIAELFRNSEVFYAYENTALALEAALCLCPTVFLPNSWFTEIIAAREMGMDGFAWGTDPAEVARAKATVHLARENYLANYTRFWDQLAGFVALTQARAVADTASYGFPAWIHLRARWYPKLATLTFLPGRTVEVFKQAGLRGVLKKTLRKLLRRAHR